VNATPAPGEAHRHHATLDPAEATVAFLLAAATQVLCDQAALVEESTLSEFEGDAMLLLVQAILLLVSFETRLLCYMAILPYRDMAAEV
jgi:hypothetical protein